jgi:hypothetical protein
VHLGRLALHRKTFVSNKWTLSVTRYAVTFQKYVYSNGVQISTHVLCRHISSCLQSLHLMPGNLDRIKYFVINFGLCAVGSWNVLVILRVKGICNQKVFGYIELTLWLCEKKKLILYWNIRKYTSRYCWNSFLIQVFLYFFIPSLFYISSPPFVKCVIHLGRARFYSICLQHGIKRRRPPYTVTWYPEMSAAAHSVNQGSCCQLQWRWRGT